MNPYGYTANPVPCVPNRIWGTCGPIDIVSGLGVSASPTTDYSKIVFSLKIPIVQNVPSNTYGVNGSLAISSTNHNLYWKEAGAWRTFTGGGGGGGGNQVVSWGTIQGSLSSQSDLQSALNAKENSLPLGASNQYLRGDKTLGTLSSSVVPEGSNLYWTQTRFDQAFSLKTTANLAESGNLYFTTARAQAAISGAASTVVSSNLTINRALMSDAAGKIVVSPVTSVELGYVSGVTSSIQAQLNSLQAQITAGGGGGGGGTGAYVPLAGGNMTGGLSITTALGSNQLPLTIVQNDTTNNPFGVSITQKGTKPALAIFQQGITTRSDSTGGGVLMDFTAAGDGVGLNIYTNRGASSNSLGSALKVVAANALYDSPIVYIKSAATSGAAANLRLERPGPDIEFYDSAYNTSSDSNGKFEIDAYNNLIRVNSRNATNSAFETIMDWGRLATEGPITIRSLNADSTNTIRNSATFQWKNNYWTGSGTASAFIKAQLISTDGTLPSGNSYLQFRGLGDTEILGLYYRGGLRVAEYMAIKEVDSSIATIPGYGKLYVNSGDKKLHFVASDGKEYPVLLGDPISGPTSTPGTVTPPPSTGTGTPPSPTSSFQDGPSQFSADGTTLTGLDVFQAGSDTVGVSGGTINMSISGGGETSVRKDLTGAKVRVARFRVNIDSAATISGEHTLFHAWRNPGTYTDFVQVRIVPSGTGFVFQLRAPDSTGFNLMKQSNVRYAKNTNLDVELYVGDRYFLLKVNGKDTVEWYNSGAGGLFDNTNKYLDAVVIGKFYSANFSGSLKIDNIDLLQDFVYPTAPATEAAKIADAWDGYKKRYVRSDGAVVRWRPEGQDGNYAAWSDVVSESQAYGLMLAVQNGDQTTFDLIETWTRTHLDRSNNSMSQGNLMGWHWDDVNNVMYDWNYATDGDIDRAVALIWAGQRWGNAGAINYHTRATAIINDLKAANLRSWGADTKKYFTTDSFQSASNPWENNASYVSVGAFQVIRDFTGDSTWDNAILGAYDLFTRATTATLTNPATGRTEAGKLPPDWNGINASTGAITTIGNRQTSFGYDGFRVIPRVRWDLDWNSRAAATTYLTSLKTFYNNEWNTNGKIVAEYDHDGTVRRNAQGSVVGNYEKSMMTFNAYWVLTTGDPGNATAAAIYSSKLSNLYKQSPAGGFYKDGPGVDNSPSYFSDSWMIINMMMKNNLWKKSFP